MQKQMLYFVFLSLFWTEIWLLDVYFYMEKKVELNEWMKFLQQIVESKLLFFFNWASIPCPVILKRINIIFSDPNMTYSLLSGVIMVNDVTSGFLQIHLFSNYLRVGKLNWFQTILAKYLDWRTQTGLDTEGEGA